MVFHGHMSTQEKIFRIDSLVHHELLLSYKKCICPIAEEYHDHLFLNLELAELSLEKEELELIILAFQKVWKNLDLLKSWEKNE